MKSLGLKIALIVFVVIVIIVGSVAVIVSNRSDMLVTELTRTQAQSANAGFAKTVQDYQAQAGTRAAVIASSPDVVNSVTAGDQPALKAALVLLGFELDVVTVTDANGIVLARMHNDTVGDSQMSQQALATALTTGANVSTIEKGGSTGLSTRGASPIHGANGEMIGAVVCGHDLSLEKYVDAFKDINQCEVTIFDGDTRMNTTLVDDTGARVIGTKASQAVIDAVLTGQQPYVTRTTLFGAQYEVYYSPLMVDGKSIGMLFTGVNIGATLAGQSEMLTWVFAVSALVGVVCLIFVFLYSMLSVGRPLRKISRLAEQIKEGNLGITGSFESKTGIRSKDEVGQMARSLEEAYTRLQGYIGEIVKRMEGLAAGDFATVSDYEFRGDFVMIGSSVNKIAEDLSGTMVEVNNASSQVSAGSQQIADGASALAQGSTEQAATVQELSASMAEVAEKTTNNAAMAKQAADLADTIKENAEKGSRQMSDMMAAVSDITMASQSISRVMKVIDDIAFQTNILALNAAVEAARAGQHGKGFAVVAEEVRNLAAKSAAAAKETGDLIANSIAKAELGAEIANGTSASLTDIVAGINQSAEIVSKITSSSDEQAVSVKQINEAIDQVANVVQQNSATAEESAAAAEELSGQSAMLEKLIGRFRIRGAEHMAWDGNTGAQPSASGFSLHK